MQDVETGFLLRSRIAQRLNVPKSVRLRPFTRCGLAGRSVWTSWGAGEALGWTIHRRCSLDGRRKTSTGAVPEEGKRASLEGVFLCRGFAGWAIWTSWSSATSPEALYGRLACHSAI